MERKKEIADLQFSRRLRNRGNRREQASSDADELHIAIVGEVEE